MGPILLPMVDSLGRELVAETNGRDRLATETPRGVWKSSETFGRYSLPTSAVIRQVDRDAIRIPFRVFANWAGVLPLDASPYADDAAYPPHLPKQRTSAKGPLF